MIVPQYWAECRKRHSDPNQAITVKRFGWSDTSVDEAQAMADERAQQALDSILAGEKLLRHEPRVAYNGAAGVPIREQVLERRGEQVLTRNVYGARCLNSPNACFVDIDFPTPHFGEVARISGFFVFVVALVAGLVSHSVLIGVAAFVAVLVAFGGYAAVKRRRLPARADACNPAGAPSCLHEPPPQHAHFACRK